MWTRYRLSCAPPREAPDSSSPSSSSVLWLVRLRAGHERAWWIRGRWGGRGRGEGDPRETTECKQVVEEEVRRGKSSPDSQDCVKSWLKPQRSWTRRNGSFTYKTHPLQTQRSPNWTQEPCFVSKCCLIRANGKKTDSLLSLTQLKSKESCSNLLHAVLLY